VLSDKQIRFCEEYLKDFNATKAALRAGYAKSTAEKQAQLWIGKNRDLSYYPEMYDLVDQERKRLSKESGITNERILLEYARIAFSDVREFLNEDGSLKDIQKLSDAAAAAIASIETDEIWDAQGRDKKVIGVSRKIKRWEKVKALDSLARILGMFEKDNEQSRPVVQITGMKIT
jgi:phage terminase small subunit